MKTGLRCARTKPRSAFGRDSHKADGLRPYCRDCTNAAAKARRDATIARGTYVRRPEKTCPACGETRPRADFSPDLGRADGLAGICKPCMAAQSRVRYRRGSGALRRRRMMRARVSESGRVAVQDGDVWTVVGSVEPVGSGWLAYAGRGRRIYGPSGPVFASREDAAEAVARLVIA